MRRLDRLAARLGTGSSMRQTEPVRYLGTAERGEAGAAASAQ